VVEICLIESLLIINILEWPVDKDFRKDGNGMTLVPDDWRERNDRPFDKGSQNI